MIAKHVAEWTRCQREQQRLCSMIDQAAERLPLRDIGFGATAVKILADVHRTEETDVFPALIAISRQVSPLLQGFEEHHRFDVLEARSLSLLLDTNEIGDIDALKARLKSFAEGIRRHVQFEEAICRALFARHEQSARAVQ